MDKQQHSTLTVLRKLTPLMSRGAVFALLWWLLTEGQTETWWFGAPLVLLAIGVSYALARPSPRSLLGLLRLLPFFIGHSLRGGFDVAWRAVHPSLPIAPVLVDYRITLNDEQAEVFLANTASLLPGTLSARLEGGCLQVHVLDGRGDFQAELEALEQRIAALFLITLDVNDDSGV